MAKTNVIGGKYRRKKDNPQYRNPEESPFSCMCKLETQACDFFWQLRSG